MPYSSTREVNLRRIHSNSQGYVVKTFAEDAYDWLYVLRPDGSEYLIREVPCRSAVDHTSTGTRHQWSGGREDECTRPESGRPVTGFVGSNPTRSATVMSRDIPPACPPLSLDDDRGDHAEHPGVALDVAQDVAVPDPGAGLVQLHEHRCSARRGRR